MTSTSGPAQSSGLKPGLKQRHMNLIALGGVIGAGLFVGSGVVIQSAGPAAVVSFLIAGLITVLIMRMLAEMTIAKPAQWGDRQPTVPQGYAISAIATGLGIPRQTLVLAATWILGFINALHHARDAWAVMPTGLVLSAVVAVLACVATWIGFSSLRAGGRP